jgi:hypothetical protein
MRTPILTGSPENHAAVGVDRLHAAAGGDGVGDGVG